MKKAIGIMVLLVLMLATLVNCPGEKVTIKVMAYGNEANQEGQNWIRIVEKFQKENPNITIDYELLYDEAYHQKVTANLAGGEKSIPDFAYMGADARWGTPWKEAGQQFDHKALMDANYYDMNLVPPMGPNGEIFEIPLGTSNITTVLYMNEELVKSLGFEAPKTYEDMKAMVPAAKAKGLEVVSIDGADGWAWGSCLMSCIIGRMSGDANYVAKSLKGDGAKFDDANWVAALTVLKTMVADGVISAKSVGVDYGTNLANYGAKKALFCVQGQWAAGSIEKAVQDQTLMLAWPTFPGEKGNAGSVAAAIQVGYGLTKKGGANPAIRDAALKFLLNYFYTEPEVTQRLRDGAIVAPILKNYKVPADLPPIVKHKVALAQKAINTDVIDAFLSGAANDALNAGMQDIVKGKTTPEALAKKVEGLVKR